MKCPRCGNELILDSHRKIPLNMCYNCGYIEGRNLDEDDIMATDGIIATNFSHLKGLNLNETAAFLLAGLKSAGVDVSEQTIVNWLMNPVAK